MSDIATYEQYDTDRVKQTVDEFVEGLDQTLEDGPGSELGGEVAGLLVERSEAEYNRLVSIGKAAVDEYERAHSG
jgi:hypothetical protein